ncbi:MAG: DUF423 domain-containing protein [Verrucomicrobia bacterium]|nr:DUF423 domain-containing protein [Verrucomicrobiota bacterium]
MLTQRFILAAASLMGGLAVVLGAFGAHALKERLDAAALAAFETAVRYQFYHALALLAVGLLMSQSMGGALRASAACFLLGTLLFSGSIYLLATRSLLPFGDCRWLGPVTPLGGLLLIAGWICLAVAAVRLPPA